MDPHDGLSRRQLEEVLSEKYIGRHVKNHTLPFSENEFVIVKIDATSYTSDEAIVPRTVVFLRSFNKGIEQHLDLEMLLDPRGPWVLLGNMAEQ